MKPALRIVLFTAALTCAAQNSVLNLQASAPPPVQSVSAAVAGPRGNASYCYWVVTNYASGSVLQTAPGCVPNAPANPTSQNGVLVSWTPMPNALSYDVVQANNNQFPTQSFCAACGLAVGLTTTSVLDIGQAVPYTLATTPPVAFWQAQIDNTRYASPRVVTQGAPFLNLVTDRITFQDGSQQVSAGVGGVNWGSISGTLSNQTDLAAALAAAGLNTSANYAITGAWNFASGRFRPPEATFASPPSSPLVHQIFAFTDASAAGVCTGGGTAVAWCWADGVGGWVSIGGAGGSVSSIPSGTPALGSILFSAIAAPGTPASGKGSFYLNSTTKNFALKNDDGVVVHGVRTGSSAGTPNLFLASIDDFGVIGYAALAAPGPAALGGVLSKDCTPGNQFIQKINTDGSENCATPTGSGASQTAQLVDWPITRTSATVLTFGSSCLPSTPCNVSIGGTVYSFTGGPWTVTQIGAHTGRACTYISNTGTLSVAIGGASLVTGDITASTGLTAVSQSGGNCPSDSLQLHQWDDTAGAWNSTGVFLASAYSYKPSPICGHGMTCTYGARDQIAANTNNGACVGTPGNTSGSFGDFCTDTTPVVYVCKTGGGCTVAADWASIGGSSGGVTITVLSTPGTSTFTCPASGKYGAEGWGGGGSGGGGYFLGGLAGPGAGYSRNPACTCTPSASVTYTVGAPGAYVSGQQGGDGGDTSISGCINAGGGKWLSSNTQAPGSDLMNSPGTGAYNYSRLTIADNATALQSYALTTSSLTTGTYFYTPLQIDLGAPGTGENHGSDVNGYAGNNALWGGASGGGGAVSAAGSATGGTPGKSKWCTGGAGGGVVSGTAAAGGAGGAKGCGGGGGGYGSGTTNGGAGGRGEIILTW